MNKINTKIVKFSAFLEDELGNAYYINIDDENQSSILSALASSFSKAIPIEPIGPINLKIRQK